MSALFLSPFGVQLVSLYVQDLQVRDSDFLTVIAAFDAQKCRMLQKHQTAIENVGFQYEFFGLNPISS